MQYSHMYISVLSRCLHSLLQSYRRNKIFISIKVCVMLYNLQCRTNWDSLIR